MTESALTPLAAAAMRRTADTRRRAIAAIRQLDHDGRPVTYAAVANTAGLSRSWLYRQPDLRTEINNLRSRSTPAAVPAAQRGSDGSQAQRIADLLHANTALHEQNRKLRAQLAVLIGQQRATP
ncbi:MAG TPA: DUF6262 family protein [Euzebya sp.]|nr:DUF6262 family protein [Euzebya sp.]